MSHAVVAVYFSVMCKINFFFGGGVIILCQEIETLENLFSYPSYSNNVKLRMFMFFVSSGWAAVRWPEGRCQVPWYGCVAGLWSPVELWIGSLVWKWLCLHQWNVLSEQQLCHQGERKNAKGNRSMAKWRPASQPSNPHIPSILSLQST